MFLAEDFFRQDYNGLQLLMLLTRLEAKAAIVRDQVVDEFKADDGALFNVDNPCWSLRGSREKCL